MRGFALREITGVVRGSAWREITGAVLVGGWENRCAFLTWACCCGRRKFVKQNVATLLRHASYKSPPNCMKKTSRVQWKKYSDVFVSLSALLDSALMSAWGRINNLSGSEGEGEGVRGKLLIQMLEGKVGFKIWDVAPPGDSTRDSG